MILNQNHWTPPTLLYHFCLRLKGPLFSLSLSVFLSVCLTITSLLPPRADLYQLCPFSLSKFCVNLIYGTLILLIYINLSKLHCMKD